MGNCIPKSLRLSSTQKQAILTRYERIRKVLLFTEDELWILYIVFLNMNKSETGYVSEDELFTYLDLDGGLFAHRVFRMFKDQTDGSISFNAFLLTCWSICTRDKNNLANFAFQLYDVQGRGELGLADVRLFLSEVFGPRFEQHKAGNDVYRSLVRFDYQNTPLEAHVDPSLFRTLSQNHPVLLFPAFELQQKLINKTLKDKWEIVTNRRDKAVKLKKFDIMNVVVLANEGRQRRGSMVPISDRHILNLLSDPFESGTNNSNDTSGNGNQNSNNLNLPAGLRRSNKIIPEPDYVALQNKLNTTNDSSSTSSSSSTGNNSSSSMVQQMIEDPKGTIGQVISTTKTAARRASIQVSAGMQNALQYAGITDSVTPVSPIELTTTSSRNRRVSLTKNNNSSEQDYSKDQMSTYVQRRSSIDRTNMDDNNASSAYPGTAVVPPTAKQRRNSVLSKSRRISVSNNNNSIDNETNDNMMINSPPVTDGTNANDALFAPRGRRRQSISVASVPVMDSSGNTLNTDSSSSPFGIPTTATTSTSTYKPSRRIITNIPIIMANDDNPSNDTTTNTPMDDEQPLIAPRGRRTSHYLSTPLVLDLEGNNTPNEKDALIVTKPKERRTSIVKNNPGQRRGSNNDTYVQAQRRASLVN